MSIFLKAARRVLGACFAWIPAKLFRQGRKPDTYVGSAGESLDAGTSAGEEDEYDRGGCCARPRGGYYN